MVRTNHPDPSAAVDRSLDSYRHSSDAEEDLYFANNRAPAYLPELSGEVQQFIEFQKQHQRKIVVVTSGGTTVPLENNTVRFIDNFSAGTRGSISAEYFLENGYAVIFLHREFSLRPYSQHYAQKSIMELLEIDDTTGKVVIKPEYEALMEKDVTNYKKCTSEKQLLEIPFTTVNQYLYTLRMIGHALEAYGNMALFYLAAAVSDFFLPTSKISEHKIQSRGLASLVIDLDPVPKFLRSLAQSWTPGAMIVSFKLETDKEILLSKCRESLQKYGHQLVIGNLLQTRKNEVYLVSSSMEKLVTHDKSRSKNIEADFLPIVTALHNDYINLGK